MSGAVTFGPPGYDPHLPRAVLQHLWRPQTIKDLSQGMGIGYTPVKMAITSLQAAGLARRHRVTGKRGIYWMWVATRVAA